MNIIDNHPREQILRIYRPTGNVIEDCDVYERTTEYRHRGLQPQEMFKEQY